MALEAGTKAPGFNAETDDGKKISLDEFIGKWVVLYFYPKDDTPGCTKEACGFRDNFARITSVGAAVLGVSPDNTDSHAKFKSKFDLNFPLISDPDKAICNAYDVFGEKTMYGKKIFGLIRSTFIIDPQGIIRHIYKNVKVEGHVDQVIAKLGDLIKG
jgi:thioredoxin-dependent peroxiredoxin